MNLDLDLGERRIIDNRLFIIGLDDLYRSSMREFEETRLLECARIVSRELGATAASVPVEGYYAESIALIEYFQVMRALQEFDQGHAGRVNHLPEFSLLHAIATSGIYGQPEGNELLPRCRDAFAQALGEFPCDQWSVKRLVEKAREVALRTGDFSLVALAARTGDPVALAATRESVVLYASIELSDEIDLIEYDWQVDDDLAAAANRFIGTLNQFGAPPLPPAEPASAATYYDAALDAELAGRCVAIGLDPGSGQYYHWAIAGELLADLHVEEFWDPQLWTTSRYKSQQIIKGGW